MTPKEKAQELFDKYFNIIDNSHPMTDISVSAKECALIAVDEILKNDTIFLYVHHLDFWKEVKQEIEKL
jgi:hypothetical protein